MGMPVRRRSSSPEADGPQRDDLPTAVDEQWEQHHPAFHEALTAARQSKLLLGFRGPLHARANRYHRLSITAPDIPRNVRTEHRLTFEAAIKRDAITATDLLKDIIPNEPRGWSM